MVKGTRFFPSGPSEIEKDSPAFFWGAVEGNIDIIRDASLRLRGSREFMLTAVELGGADVFQYASSELRNDNDS
ncbi:MAG: DUF4116 domain-containing protein, partial [Gammaproteobacteria bacterium]|nr:DUF4116 domain-containing protein [Gammaproteobacteria bacterium]